jgi:hypothetical protein
LTRITRKFMPSADLEELSPKHHAGRDSGNPWLGAATTTGPLLLAATALGAGLAFYLGWAYEKAYVEEWGLEFSAFSYDPYQLMVTSSTTLVWAISTPLALILAELLRPLLSLDTIFEAPETVSRRIQIGRSRPVLAAMLVGGVLGGLALFVAASFLLGDLKTGLGVLWVVLLIVAAFSWKYARAGSSSARWLLLSALVFGAFFILVVAPSGLGRSDAQHDKEHVEQLPRIEIVLHHSLGLDSERPAGDRVRTGPWRLIRVNDGHLWLVADVDKTNDVVQIDSSDVASITYLPDE